MNDVTLLRDVFIWAYERSAQRIIPPEALAGHRNDAVYIRNSNHVPPRWQAVRDAMPTLFKLISEEKEPAVRAVLGH